MGGTVCQATSLILPPLSNLLTTTHQISNTGLVLKCIIHNIRIPDGLHLSYASLLTQFYPSPSRLLMLLDPLLMVGILSKCVNAYKDKNYMESLPR